MSDVTLDMQGVVSPRPLACCSCFVYTASRMQPTCYDSSTTSSEDAPLTMYCAGPSSRRLLASTGPTGGVCLSVSGAPTFFALGAGLRLEEEGGRGDLGAPLRGRRAAPTQTPAPGWPGSTALYALSRLLSRGLHWLRLVSPRTLLRWHATSSPGAMLETCG